MSGVHQEVHVGRLFGTDGVRGMANVDLTAELALDLAVAAAHVLGDAGDVRGAPPDRCGRVATRGPPASSWRPPSSRASPAPASTCCVVGVLPTPAIAYLTGAARRRPRRHALGQPQPDAGQRHQVLRPRRPQAARRGRGRRSRRGSASRGSARAAPASAGSRRTTSASGSTSTTCSSTLAAPPRRADGRRRLPRTARRPGSRPQALRRRAPTSSRSAPSPTA